MILEIAVALLGVASLLQSLRIRKLDDELTHTQEIVQHQHTSMSDRIAKISDTRESLSTRESSRVSTQPFPPPEKHVNFSNTPQYYPAPTYM